MLEYDTQSPVPTSTDPAEPILLVEPEDFVRLHKSRRLPWKLLMSIVGVALAGLAFLHFYEPGPDPVPYRLAKIERGDLVVVVTATGILQPVTSVPVGAQITGRIQALHADFNTRVQKGDLLAEIDPAPFQSRLDQDRASLDHAEADVERVQAGLIQAEKELSRARLLAKRELIAPAEADAALATRDSFAAQLKTAYATVAGAKAAVAASEINLKYCTIVSPIDGIILSRNVDVGQTVSAGLQAPTLYLLAGGLSQVQILASVSEADIGKIRVGQKVKFTVEAYRDEPLQGRVSSIRLSSVTIQNVVTYSVMIECKNPGERLLPGMTAMVLFMLSEKKDVLRVPNAAFRFKPEEKDGVRPPPVPSARTGERPLHRVWCLVQGRLTPKDVECGETDGTRTRLLGDLLREGDEVVIGGLLADAPATTANNPFAPPPRRRR